MTYHPGCMGTSGLSAVGTATPSSRLTEIRKYSPLGASEREYLSRCYSAQCLRLSLEDNLLPALLVA